MPHVASKASVLKPQQTGLPPRERAGAPQDSASPFSMLLAETDGASLPPRQSSTRSLGTTPTQRSDAPRGTMHRTDADRPGQADAPDGDAPEAGVTQTPATNEGDDAATEEQIRVAAAGQMAILPPESPQPAESAENATNDDAVAAVAAFAAVVDTPAQGAQPAASGAPVVAAAPAPAAPATDAPAPASAPDVAPATTPSDTSAAAPPAADTTEAAQLPAPQAAPESQTSQPHEAIAQQAETRTPPQAKPSGDSTRESATQTQSTTTPPDAMTTAASTTTPDQTETKSAPKQAAHADTPSHGSPRADGPDAPERPQAGNAVSDFVHATQPSSDSSHLAHLQSGRDFGQAVAATAQASHHGADASNQLVSAPVPLESLAVEIATRAQGGRSRFEIRLDPPELGRIDVRLDIDRSGNVTSRLVVEKAETLDVLRRDAHQLERALQDAGLKTSDNGLQFSLRDHAFAERQDRGGSDTTRTLIADPELPAAEGAPQAYGLTLRGGSGIDIRV